MNKKEEKKINWISSHFKSYYYFYIALLVLLVLLFIYIHLSSQFKVGEVVYSKNDPSKIGIVKAFSITKMSYAVNWINGEVSEEKASDLDYIYNLDIERINKTDNPSTDSINYGDVHNFGDKENNFNNYVYEATGSGKITGIFYKNLGLRINERNCQYNFVCEDWSECQINYDISSLSAESEFSGIQYKLCVDQNKCFPSIIDSRSCYLKENITAVKKIVCGKEQIELLSAEGQLLARLSSGRNFTDVTINLAGGENC